MTSEGERSCRRCRSCGELSAWTIGRRERKRSRGARAPRASARERVVERRDGAQRASREHVVARRGDAGERDALRRGTPSTATSLAALSTAGARAAGAQRLVREARHGKRARSGASKSSAPSATRSSGVDAARRCARDTRAPARSACACRGAPSCASTEPSTYSTSEWMTLCGWITTSIASRGDAEQPVRLDHLEALVHHRRRVDRDLAAHRPVRMRARLVGRDVVRASRRRACGTARPTR